MSRTLNRLRQAVFFPFNIKWLQLLASRFFMTCLSGLSLLKARLMGSVVPHYNLMWKRVPLYNPSKCLLIFDVLNCTPETSLKSTSSLLKSLFADVRLRLLLPYPYFLWCKTFSSRSASEWAHYDNLSWLRDGSRVYARLAETLTLLKRTRCGSVSFIARTHRLIFLRLSREAKPNARIPPFMSAISGAMMLTTSTLLPLALIRTVLHRPSHKLLMVHAVLNYSDWTARLLGLSSTGFTDSYACVLLVPQVFIVLAVRASKRTRFYIGANRYSWGTYYDH